MELTFFNYLGLADMEKVHTQTLQWILSKDNRGLSNVQKSKFFLDCFDISNFNIKKIHTEYKNTDLLIVSDDAIICIENKIKSSLHSNQLNRYKNIIDTHFNDKKNIHYFFLSLVDQKNDNANWINITYQTILSALQKLDIQNNIEGGILKEYMKTLENFQEVINSFLENPKNFPNVFEEASKKKYEKNNNNSLSIKQQFVRDNQLETLFQKLYLKKIADHLSLENYYLTETRGNAILGMHIKRDIMINDKLFHFGFDYQSGTFKTMIIASNYKNSKNTDIPDAIVKLFEKVKNNYSKYGYTRMNKGKTKAQHSITKTFKEIESIEDFSERFNTELTNSIKVIQNEFIPQLKMNN